MITALCTLTERYKEAYRLSNPYLKPQGYLLDGLVFYVEPEDFGDYRAVSVDNYNILKKLVELDIVREILSHDEAKKQLGYKPATVSVSEDKEFGIKAYTETVGIPHFGGCPTKDTEITKIDGEAITKVYKNEQGIVQRDKINGK